MNTPFQISVLSGHPLPDHRAIQEKRSTRLRNMRADRLNLLHGKPKTALMHPLGILQHPQHHGNPDTLHLLIRNCTRLQKRGRRAAHASRRALRFAFHRACAFTCRLAAWIAWWGGQRTQSGDVAMNCAGHTRQVRSRGSHRFAHVGGIYRVTRDSRTGPAHLPDGKGASDILGRNST
jgi:hypothetical protein